MLTVFSLCQMCWGVHRCGTFSAMGRFIQGVAGLFPSHQKPPMKESGGKLSMWNKGPMAVWKLLLFHTGIIPVPFRNGCRRLRLPSDETPTTKMSESLFQNCLEKGRSQVTHSVGLGSAGGTHGREQMTFCKVFPTSGTAPLLQMRHSRCP